MTSATMRGQAETPQDRASVIVGIDNHYRVGCWTAVRFVDESIDESIATGAGSAVALETLDGDGVRVRYVQEHEFASGRFGYAVPGTEAAPLVIKNDDRVLVATRFPEQGIAARGPAMIPRGMPWVLVIGDSLGIEEIGRNELLNRPSSIAVTQPSNARSFPDRSIGYDGLDLAVITASGAEVLSRFDSAQQAAFQDWVQSGGRLFITLGEQADQLVERVPWLRQVLPEALREISIVEIDPSALEAYTSTQIRLEPFLGADLPRDAGQIAILGRTIRKVSTPVAVDYVVGLGRVTVIAADLESDLFAQWPQRIDLVTRLNAEILSANDSEPTQTSRATSYQDLAGQMRSALDQFVVKRSTSFSLIALTLLLLIALVGPIDYWLINRIFGKPLLGWLSFPVIAIGLSLLLVWLSGPTSESTGGTSSEGVVNTTAVPTGAPVHSNRVEFVDIDMMNRIGRGTVWTYLYTHEARQLSLRAESTESFNLLAGNVSTRLLAPFGYPGPSFGGIQIVGDDSRMPSYDIPVHAESQSITSSIVGLAFAPRSSKSIGTRYQFEPKIDDITVKRRRGSELLEGSITNPLPLDLFDGMLVYRNWAYLLPTRFRAGDTVNSLDSLRQKNFRWQLSRQRAVESSSEGEAWDPANTRSINRIAEMLMFYDAVGGPRYTRLDNQEIEHLDLSHLLVDDRCMLIGRLGTPLSRLSVAGQSDTSALPDEATRMTYPETNSQSYLRLIIPVRSTGRF